jgi:hypothetical protein
MQIDLMLLMIVVPPPPPDPSSKGVTTSFESIYKCCWQKWWVFSFYQCIFTKLLKLPIKFHMLVDEYFDYIPKPTEHPIQKCIITMIGQWHSTLTHTNLNVVAPYVQLSLQLQCN